MPSTVTIRLQGGLGNQMFQFAFGRAIVGDRRLLFDPSSFAGDLQRDLKLDCFDLDLEFTTPSFPVRTIQSAPGMWRVMRPLGGHLPLPGCHMIWDRMAGFDEGMTRVTGSIRASGYWQDERYFKAIEDDIRASFVPVHEFQKETGDLFEIAPGSIGVQIRRGDYADQRVAQVHPPPPSSYYEEAVGRLVDKHGVKTAIICSDDLEWSRSHVELPVEKTIFREEPVQEWEDMFLLAKCAHVVISNSSFGWWSAWLGKAEGRTVICPKKWYGSKGAAFSHPGLDTWEFVQY